MEIDFFLLHIRKLVEEYSLHILRTNDEFSLFDM